MSTASDSFSEAAPYLYSLRGVRAELEDSLPKPPGTVIELKKRDARDDRKVFSVLLPSQRKKGYGVIRNPLLSLASPRGFEPLLTA